MKKIKIKKDLPSYQREVLKELKSYTYVVNSYSLVFTKHNTYLRFVYSGKNIEFNFKLDDELIQEVITALTEAGKNIYFKVQ